MIISKGTRAPPLFMPLSLTVFQARSQTYSDINTLIVKISLIT